MIKKQGKGANYYTYGAVCTLVEIDVLTGEHEVCDHSLERLRDIEFCFCDGLNT